MRWILDLWNVTYTLDPAHWQKQFGVWEGHVQLPGVGWFYLIGFGQWWVGGGSWKLMRGVVSTKEKLYTLKILHRLAALKVPSTTLTTAPSFKPSIMWSSAKSSSRTPSICSEKHVLWQLSGRSRTTCRRSCTLSRRENWRRHEMKNKAVLIFMKNSSPW